tara:strand:- start:355 stop:1482 length:1128 start_codon:yes stop_codon:yes gene_type:complete
MFNIGAFIGGMARGGSQILDENRAQAKRDKETKEQQGWIIATEARADARDRKRRRNDKKDLADERIATLVGLNFTTEQATSAVAGGEGLYEQYKSVGTKAFENGQNASELLALNNNSTQLVNTTLEGANQSSTKEQGLGAYKWNNESVAALFGTPPPAAKSVDLQLAQNAKDQLVIIQGVDTAKSQEKLKALQDAETFLIKKLAAVAEAERDNTTTKKPVTVTQRATLERLITTSHAGQTKQYGLGYDSETQLEIAFAGNEGSGYSALLNSTYKMENTLGVVGDDWINTRLKEERASIERGLNRHGQTVYNASKDDSSIVKTFADFTEYEAAIKSGNIKKLGAVSIVKGVPYVYTGVPNVDFSQAPIYKITFGSN